jgi:uncharacterized protein with NAD-binding domain and iron-sulfur cluster
MADPNPNKKIKIAIVGGGCGALTAAFELSQDANHEVTVYQMGWRLGGKGASGRNPDRYKRTQEHGLHVWMGFYENSFRLIRKCYEELAEHYPAVIDELTPVDNGGHRNVRQSPFASWDEAFFPDHWVGVADESFRRRRRRQDQRGAWRTWTSYFPATPGLPGDPLDSDTNPFSLSNYLARTCDLLRALIHSSYAGRGEKTPSVDDLSSVTPRGLVDKLTSALRTGILTGASALYEAASVLKVVLSGRFSLPDGDYLVLKYAEAVAANVKAQAEDLFAGDADLGPKLELVELVVTVIVGILRDRLLADPDGLDAINDEDCRIWLARHGASERATGSPLVRALYNMAFADEKCHPRDEPGLAAGQALRGAMRMFFTYRGSLFWKMRGGMGDAVFSPLYEVLKNRGVRFEFFHELVDVVTGPDPRRPRRVTELHFRRQASPRAAGDDWREDRLSDSICSLEAKAVAAGEYYPLDEAGCWPASAIQDRFEVISDHLDFETPSSTKVRAAEHENLRVLKQRDAKNTAEIPDSELFDCVVLGVSIGALPQACGTLLKGDKRWAAMVEQVKTIPTQALQLWFNEGVEALCSSPTPITVSGFLGPFDTWSDMTHVIAQEDWEAVDTPPKGLVYFCGSLPYSQVHNETEARASAVDYLDNVLPLLWPQVGSGKHRGFRWDLLAGTGQDLKDARLSQGDKLTLLDSQYFAINVNPSDRYVLTRPGTMQYRISPLDCGYENMTVAGDWTDCGFNEGCVEAAVMSGRLAAYALCLQPSLDEIIGFDHP